VYELAEVRRAYTQLRGCLPEPSTLLYSLKANPHPVVLRTLCELGAEAEVCSPGELYAALDAGFRSDDLLYTGPGKRDADIAGALAAGVTRFSVDSPHGMDQLDQAAAAAGRDVRCLLRVNDDTPVPGQRLTMTGVPSQFGADLRWIEADPGRFAGRPRVRLDGLHLYMGSQVAEEDRLVAQFGQAVTVAARVAAALGTEFAEVNLGGGFGAPFAREGDLPKFPALAERVATCLDERFGGWRQGRPRVLFESGRYLVAAAGRLVVRVLDVKMSQGHQIVVLESGVNHLGGMSGLRRIPEMAPTLVGPRTGPVVPGTLVSGPLCTPLDTWARRADVAAVRPGDLVEIRNVGAYGLYASLIAFLGHPAPLEIVVDDGEVRDVSRVCQTRASVPLYGRE
jgi:diaminopimelate decarboxylase